MTFRHRSALLCSVHRLIFYQDKHKITCITPFMLSSSVMRFKHLIRRFARHHNITYNQLSYAMHLNQNRLTANHIVSHCVRYSECMHYFNFIRSLRNLKSWFSYHTFTKTTADVRIRINLGKKNNKISYQNSDTRARSGNTGPIASQINKAFMHESGKTSLMN